MKPEQTGDMRELTASEMDAVNGGSAGAVVAVVVALAIVWTVYVYTQSQKSAQ